MKALSAAKVRGSLEPGRYADGNCLYLLVDDNGAKHWVLRVVVGGKRRDIGLGGVKTMALTDARDEATRLRKIARAGGDPLLELRRERRQIPTFREGAIEYHATLIPGFRNEKHQAQWIDTLEDHAFPFFGDRRLDHVQSGDVLAALNAIWLKTPETARRVKQRINAVMAWAKAKGYRSENPVDDLQKVLPKHNTPKGHFAALPYGKVPGFIAALRASESGLVLQLAFEFLIVTACRTSEVLLAEWSEFNLEEKTWTIPAARMKAKVEHRVPLSGRCVEILEAAKTYSDGGPFVFPGRPRRPFSNQAFIMCARRMKWQGLTPHGFRSSFRDWAEERTSFPHRVIEAALAHTVKNKVEAAYLRTDLFEKRRELMDTWATFATEPGAKVMRIRA